MVERVRYDGVLFGEQRLEQTSVGIEACSIQDGVFGLEIIGNCGFKLFVHVLCSANESY